ncbi:hypothetical protein HY623_02355 [Candidatus Uhrbacteria bacterium]|nr:hypothetical protein [Candidatus Uhrbacteria bacterium]
MREESMNEDQGERQLEKNLAETENRYRNLFSELILPQILAQPTTAQTTHDIALVFEQALPADPELRNQLLDALEQRTNLVEHSILLAAYESWSTGWKK